MSPPKPLEVRSLVIVGDLHGKWNDADERYFNHSDADLIVFIGDLGSGTRKDGLNVIRGLSHLRKPTFVLGGNNDAEHLPHLAAELAYQSGRSDLLAMLGRSKKSEVFPIGYSSHNLLTNLGPVTLIAGRPLSQGGSKLGFPELLDRIYGVTTIEESLARYRELIDQAEEKLLFVAHNGPTGLGETPTSLWGRDFRVPEEVEANFPKDFGDSDLEEAVAYAKSKGRRVLGVIAGHMHRSRKNQREFTATRGETIYVNAGFVPRIAAGEQGEELHHHVRVAFDDSGLNVTEHWVSP